MKNIVVLFAGFEPGHNFEKKFGDKSSFELCLSWAQTFAADSKIVILTNKKSRSCVENSVSENKNIVLVENENWTNAMIARTVAEKTAECGADFAVYSFADCPFINTKLTQQIIHDHVEYKAEYTFADGFAGGLTPEIIDRGAAAIIASLAETTQKTAGDKTASRDCFFSIMSGDINSFEIETVLADKDYRMLRFMFEASSKSGLIACSRLFDAAKKEKLEENLSDCDVYRLSDLAESMASIQQTVPHFYNIQLSSSFTTNSLYNPSKILLKDKKLSDMTFDNFKSLVRKIAGFSEEATISLSLFGEPLLNSRFVDCVREVLSYPGLSLFIETDGLCITEDIASALANVNNSVSAWGKIDWAVQLDAFDGEMYSKINGIDGSNYSKALENLSLLEKYFEGKVYPQFTRMKANESQLESFFRFWSKKDSPSKGQLIIMKYDNCAGALSDEKPADLSPLERNACWHIRRDMNILSDGSVLMCRSRPDEVMGNAFTDDLEKIWSNLTPEVENHIKQNYCSKCRACDEYYTFNF